MWGSGERLVDGCGSLDVHHLYDSRGRLGANGLPAGRGYGIAELDRSDTGAEDLRHERIWFVDAGEQPGIYGRRNPSDEARNGVVIADLWAGETQAHEADSICTRADAHGDFFRGLHAADLDSWPWHAWKPGSVREQGLDVVPRGTMGAQDVQEDPMGDFIVVDGTMVTFLPMFPPAIVTPIPTTIKASAKKVKACKKNVCLEGDEKQVKSMGCMYLAPPGYPIPGMGTLKIDALDGAQLTKKVKAEGKPMILKGMFFKAVFEVMMPAMQLPPPAMGGAPDSMSKYMNGKGSFMEVTNLFVKAS